MCVCQYNKLLICVGKHNIPSICVVQSNKLIICVGKYNIPSICVGKYNIASICWSETVQCTYTSAIRSQGTPYLVLLSQKWDSAVIPRRTSSYLIFAPKFSNRKRICILARLYINRCTFLNGNQSIRSWLQDHQVSRTPILACCLIAFSEFLNVNFQPK